MTNQPVSPLPFLAPAAPASSLGSRLLGAWAALRAVFSRPATTAPADAEPSPVSRETWALGYAGFDRAAYRMHLRTSYNRTRI